MEPYSVEGLGVGMPVVPESWQYKRYHCRPSEQYANSIWCNFSELKGGVSKLLTILHLSSDNIVTYINKELSPAFFTNSEVAREIERLSRQFNGPAHIYRSPNRPGLPGGIIATWGDIELQPLTPNDLATLADGKNPHVGVMVDYLINFYESARAGLPVYSLSGGKGYVWIARFDQQGKGKLRFFAADPSQMERQVPHPQEPSQAHPQEPPQAPSQDLSEALERLQNADQQMRSLDEKLLSPEQAERYRSLRREIDKLSTDADKQTVSKLAAKVEKFTKQADAATAVAKEIQACKALKEKLASEESAGIPVAILQKRDDAILRFSALKESSTLDDIKPVRAALENAERSIADFKDFLEFRRLADQTIARIETEMGLLIDIDDEIRKELEQRISNAKRALKSESFADAKQSVSELTNFYEAHSDELKSNKFEPN
jgi:hypothetical protein